MPKTIDQSWVPDSLKGDVAVYKGKEGENGQRVSDRISASSLIQLGDNCQCFSKMNDAQDLEMLKMTNPNAAYHEVTRRAFGIHDDSESGVFEASVDGQLGRRKPVVLHAAGTREFGNGATVRDKKKKRTGIIIKASVGHSKVSHTPAHRIADQQGNVWVAKETDLKLIS